MIQVWLLVLVALGGAYVLNLLRVRRAKLKRMPPKIPGIPIIGDLRFVGKDAHEIHAREWRRLGPVATLETNGNLSVLVAGMDAAKELLLKQGHLLVDRPAFRVFEDARAEPGNGLTAGLGLLVENGAVFREQRRFALSTLRDLGFGRPIIEDSIHEQVTALLEEIEAKDGDAFDPTILLSNTVANVIAQVLFGRSFRKDEPTFLDAIDNFTAFTRKFHQTQMLAIPESMLQLIAFHPEAKKTVAAVKELAAVQRTVIGSIVKERNETHKVEAEDTPTTYVDAFRQMQDANTGEYFSHAQLLAGTSDLFGAGTDTTATTIRWVLVHLMRDAGLQERAAAAVVAVVGRDRLPALEDRPALPLIDAVLAETQRLTNLIPWVGRRAVADIHYKEYVIPAGTITLTNIYAMARDPEVWEDPDEFRPERFLTPEGRLDKERLDLISPFGMGKRKCLGESLARAEMFLLATSLVQRFRFTSPGPAPSVDDHFRSLVLAPHPFQTIATRRH